MADVQAIVSLLSAPPLEHAISLLELSQKSPQQLRQLLVLVLCFINPNQKRSLEHESLEASTASIMELLRTFNYFPSTDPITFRQGLATGSADVIYPLLAWLLQQVSGLKKQVYLSQVLSDVEIPGELLVDEDVNVLQAQCDALRVHFKANYCRLESLGKLHAQKGLSASQEQVQKLEAERSHLLGKVSKMKSKLQSVPKLDQMLELVTQYRTELFEDTNFVESLKQQNEALIGATRKHGKALLKLEYVQTLASSPATFIVEKIAQEILMLRYLSKTKLPKELEVKQRHFQALQSVINDPNYSEDKISRIQAKLVAANNELKTVRKRNSSDRGGEDVGGSPAEWQQSAIVADRLRVAFEKLALLTQKKEQVVVELSEKTRLVDEAKGTVLKGEELKSFVESLRAKSNAYRTKKKEIDDMASELGALKKTQELLEQQASTMPTATVPEGFPELRNKAVDLDKAIETLTTLDTEVAGKIKQVKHNIAPKVKVLQFSRKARQDLETACSETRSHLAEVSSQCERKVCELEAQTETLRRELAQENKRFQEQCAATQAVEASLDELSKEEQSSSVSAGLRTKLQQQEDLKTTLEQRQHKLKDVEQYNYFQMMMMKDLVTLLSAKLRQYASASRPAIYSTVTALETDEDKGQLFLTTTS